eukprot:CAMPEP_0202892612 /NCGR_PEP_ID=MMETSP1392-20130828/2325_1 /ASSEMBLY_ACC=CAM_ASM_000868 /TAXON_ID=225041 /ORGANISM="Chlamydomonas chlamydogama, Strain SAG 11-48b" /LENGTH=36 /DNA_ID= /DNA_START= /DNA_END= /DNA_ORIENTATION=
MIRASDLLCASDLTDVLSSVGGLHVCRVLSAEAAGA